MSQNHTIRPKLKGSHVPGLCKCDIFVQGACNVTSRPWHLLCGIPPCQVARASGSSLSPLAAFSNIQLSYDKSPPLETA